MSGAVDQFLLLRAVALDRRTSKGDVAVLAEIIQRHMKKHSNARASYTHLTNMTGLSRRAAINSGQRLVELGYIMVGRLGSGTRPTEYVPNWKIAASGEADFTSTSGEAQFTTVVNSTSLLEPLEVNHTSPHNPTYVTGRQAELQESRNGDTPDPLPAPIGASGSRDPEDAFGRFWKVFPRKYQKQKARAAWDRLAPDADLAEYIIERAGKWAEHYAEHNTDRKWIPTPANWLTGERYDEDLPTVYADPKEAALAKAKDRQKDAERVAINEDQEEPQAIAAADGGDTNVVDDWQPTTRTEPSLPSGTWRAYAERLARVAEAQMQKEQKWPDLSDMTEEEWREYMRDDEEDEAA